MVTGKTVKKREEAGRAAARSRSRAQGAVQQAAQNGTGERAIPDLVGHEGMRAAVAEMLAMIQTRRQKMKVRQVSWGVDDEAVANPSENAPPISFKELWDLLDGEETRIAQAWPELVEEIKAQAEG